MGRKKIKIRPIKDDRNRAVTFLKRKNGLFKKAFELAVLCRAEVAVIVFASNKKLYEFASSDMKDVLYRYTQAPEPYEHRGPEDFLSKDDADSDDSDDVGMEEYPRMSHTPQPQPTQQFHHLDHHRRTSEDSIGSGRRASLHPGTPQILPHRTPPIHSRQHSLHMNTPPQQFQVPMVPQHGSPQQNVSAVRGGIMMQDNMGLGIGMTTPQPYGMSYNPYGQQQVYMNQEQPPPPPRRPSSNPSNYYPPNQQNPYLPSPPLPPIAPQPPQSQHVTEIKSTKGRMKSIHTPVSSRASSLAAHFDTARQYERPPPPPPVRSHSVDSGAHNVMSNIPLSLSPPPITTTTPGSTSSVPGQRPKLSLHIPDDEDPNQPEESGASATPGTASPETTRDSSDVKREHNVPDGDPDRQQFFLPPPQSSLPNGRLPGPALGAFDSNNSGGTPLSALPSRYAGDMLPSPSTFYPEFYASLPSAGTSAVRGGYGGIMNGTPVVSSRADEGGTNFGYGYTGGEKRRGEELSGGSKRARS